jgi:hypothetical protein
VLNLEQEEPGAFTGNDLLLGHIVAGQLGSAIYRCQLVDELEGAFLTTLGVLADAVELQDAYTADHANEVADQAVAVGKRMGIGRAGRRQWLPRRPRRRGDPARGDDHRHLRRLPRDDLGSLLPTGDAAVGGDPRAKGRSGYAIRSRRSRRPDR